MNTAGLACPTLTRALRKSSPLFTLMAVGMSQDVNSDVQFGEFEDWPISVTNHYLKAQAKHDVFESQHHQEWNGTNTALVC